MPNRRSKPGHRGSSRQIIPSTEKVQWSYGIIAVAERTTTLLPLTIESLAHSGFDKPVVFVDGRISCKYKYDLIVSHRTKIGHPNNWITALFYLYSTQPQANRYALFEDDLLACKDLRPYLELWQFPERGYWNLLTHNENLSHTKNVKGWHPANQRGKGAVGLVFNREGVEAILSDRNFLSYRRGVDGMVIHCLKKHGFTEYIHYPSLLQHQGTTSTLGHRFGQVKAFKGVGYSPLEDPCG